MRRTWDGDVYQRVSSALDPLADQVLARLDLRGDETVLDAGCGTGRITARLAERLPRGSVVAVDADPDMVRVARTTVPANVRVVHGDLLELDLRAEVDAVFSTATFHWILDHDRLFGRLAAALRPGGTLVAQCGGRGNITSVIDAATEVARDPRWAESLARFSPNWSFRAPEEATEMLERAGFTDVRCWLQAASVVPEDPLAYLEAVPLGSWVQLLPPRERQPFIERVASLLPDPLVLDYVRLNIDARRRT